MESGRVPGILAVSRIGDNNGRINLFSRNNGRSNNWSCNYVFIADKKVGDTIVEIRAGP